MAEIGSGRLTGKKNKMVEDGGGGGSAVDVGGTSVIF
jgi:hypothetical protein